MKNETQILSNQQNSNSSVINEIEYNEKKLVLNLKNGPLSFEEINSPTVETNNKISETINDVKNNWNKKYPDELKPYFTVESRMIGKNLNYFTKATHRESYEKFPLTISYTVTVNKKEEGISSPEEFWKKILRKSEETGKPVEIPNVNFISEKLGDYEDPLSIINQNRDGNFKLYVMPTKKETKKFIIDIYDGEYSLKIISDFTFVKKEGKNYIFNNDDDVDNKYKIQMTISNLMQEDNQKVKSKFSITINLKEEYEGDLEANIDLMIYRFLLNTENCLFSLKLCNEDSFFDIFVNQKFNENKTDDLNLIRNTIDLLKKIRYISKFKNIEIPFDYSYFMKESDLINLVYNEMKNMSYDFINGRDSINVIEGNVEEKELIKYSGKLALISHIESVNLFGTEFKLRPNRMVMEKCEILDYNKDTKEVKLRSYNCKLELLDKNDKL